MKRTYKYRLYPSKQQENVLTQWLTTCRLLYNNSLAERMEAWKTMRRTVTYTEQANQLKNAKKSNPNLRSIHSQVLQDVLRRLDKAFKNFFKRMKIGKKAGYPRFKGKNRYDSFTYPQSGFTLKKKTLTLSRIDKVNIKLHRPIPSEGIIKTCTIKRDVDRWYACFSVELPEGKPSTTCLLREVKQIGIDVGLKSLLTLSSGGIVENPRWFKRTEKKLAKGQRSLSRKRKGSNNREGQRIKVARLHRRVRNQRKDFHHKISRELVKTYDLIVFENLTIKNMVKNPHLAKSIADAAWGQLIRFTQYKAEEAGMRVKYVAPRGTSQVCSGCGSIISKTLAVRVHECPYCELVLDRDVNAAINILGRSSSGQELPVEPVRHIPLGNG
ncbi:MAG: RNA-guided endonuclease InsQ/TnpB family protein [Candidatus Hodarchaeota archaeon]